MLWSCLTCVYYIATDVCARLTSLQHSYGSIISNIGAALVGGPGIVPGANLGREFALFEPGCRHVAKDIMVCLPLNCSRVLDI